MELTEKIKIVIILQAPVVSYLALLMKYRHTHSVNFGYLNNMRIMASLLPTSLHKPAKMGKTLTGVILVHGPIANATCFIWKEQTLTSRFDDMTVGGSGLLVFQLRD